MMSSVFDAIKKENRYASDGSEGFHSDTKWWVDTGSYMFNALLSGSFFKGFPGNKIVGFAGANSSGKTQITLNILKNFLDANPINHVVYYDSEGAITTDMILGFKEPKRILHVVVPSANFFKNSIYKAIRTIEEERERKVFINYLIVLDSLGTLSLESDTENVLKDKDTADMGKRAQYLKEIFRKLTPQLSILQVPMIVTAHTYDSMSLYSSKQISGGGGLQYAANTIVEFSPSKLKKENEVVGINITAKCRKGRSTIQYKTTEMALMHHGGMLRYYYLLDFALDRGYLIKGGNKIKMKDGSLMSKKEIDKSPDKFFTEPFLKELDIYANDYFMYSQINENVELDEEITL
jgi:RecA/RadA recombinase